MRSECKTVRASVSRCVATSTLTRRASRVGLSQQERHQYNQWMTDLLAARLQMAISLGFHIIFAVAGIAMPLMMVIAEIRWLRSGDNALLALTRSWAKGTAILFAVGAVSG